MVTGDDSVLLVGGDVVCGIIKFLDGMKSRWPEMRVSIEGDGDGSFHPWSADLVRLPSGSGVILIARDSQMEAWWDDHGYSLDSVGEGPLSVWYRPAEWRSLRIDLLEDPMSRAVSKFIPYEGILVGANYYVVSIVTPSLQSSFSAAIIDDLVGSLASATGSGG
jgi:hypothetical protein